MNYCCSFEILPNFEPSHLDFHFILGLINYEVSLDCINHIYNYQQLFKTCFIYLLHEIL